MVSITPTLPRHIGQGARGINFLGARRHPGNTPRTSIERALSYAYNLEGDWVMKGGQLSLIPPLNLTNYVFKT